MITLNRSNFIKYFIFDPNSELLSPTDKKIAIVAKLMLGLLTVGIAYLVCYWFFYDKKFVSNPMALDIVQYAKEYIKSGCPNKLGKLEKSISAITDINVCLLVGNKHCPPPLHFLVETNTIFNPRYLQVLETMVRHGAVFPKGTERDLIRSKIGKCFFMNMPNNIYGFSMDTSNYYGSMLLRDIQTYACQQKLSNFESDNMSNSESYDSSLGDLIKPLLATGIQKQDIIDKLKFFDAAVIASGIAIFKFIREETYKRSKKEIVDQLSPWMPDVLGNIVHDYLVEKEEPSAVEESLQWVPHNS